MFALCTRPMPPDTLATYPHVTVRIACACCSRVGQYRLARLAAKFGAEIAMNDLLAFLAGDRAYAMCNAAHATLMAAGFETEAAPVKTHDGLIEQFGRHLVQGGKLDAQHGRALAQVENIRHQADYASVAPSSDNARWSIDRATAFLAAIRAVFPMNV